MNDTPLCPTEFTPLVPFTDDPSPSFVHGFEAGMIWWRMQSGEDEIEPVVPLHAANERVLRHMAQVCGYEADLRHCGGGLAEWMQARFTKRPAGKTHLSAVGRGNE